MLVLLGERSQQNSYFKHVIATYLYATGASRQAISVTAHLGLSSSYTTIAAGSTTEYQLCDSETRAGAPPNGKHHTVLTRDDLNFKTGGRATLTIVSDYSQSDSEAAIDGSDSAIQSDADTESEEDIPLSKVRLTNV